MADYESVSQAVADLWELANVMEECINNGGCTRRGFDTMEKARSKVCEIAQDLEDANDAGPSTISFEEASRRFGIQMPKHTESKSVGEPLADMFRRIADDLDAGVRMTFSSSGFRRWAEDVENCAATRPPPGALECKSVDPGNSALDEINALCRTALDGHTDDWDRVLNQIAGIASRPKNAECRSVGDDVREAVDRVCRYFCDEPALAEIVVALVEGRVGDAREWFGDFFGGRPCDSIPWPDDTDCGSVDGEDGK